ncbi:MAG: Ni/Fe-hydrogenase cytochrome b subunit [Gammaproteobacteria bacterium]
MSKHQALALGGRVATVPFMLFSIVALVGLVLLAQRFLFGLGAVANINQGYPWGIWVAYDVVIGTAFGCGGYALALLVYVLNKGEYHPLVRPALLASVFGYTLGAFSAFFDMGRYWNFYNMFLPWQINLNSVMLEVGLCVTAYTLVLWIEFAPAVLERFNLKDKLRLLNRFLFIVIAVGILLPTMHQSSLGSLMIAAGHKLSPLWQTPLLPLLFLVSAIAMGFSIVMFESSLSAVGLRRPLETPLLAKLGRIVAGMLVGYLVLRFADLILRGQLGLVFAGDLKAFMFWVETLLYVAPVVVLSSARLRARPGQIFLAATAMLLAGTIYRFNAFLIGFDPGAGFHYFPSVSEILVSLGIIAIEIVGYIWLVKRLPVMPRLETAKA